MHKSNVEFWTKKFERNVARDKSEHKALEIADWHVIIIWECEIKKRLEAFQDEIKNIRQEGKDEKTGNDTP